MKILFTTLFRVKTHATLFASSIFALIGLTVFSQLEMLAFGAIAKSGDDLHGMKGGKIAEIFAWIKGLLGFESTQFYTIALIFLFVGLSKAAFLFANKFLTKVLAVRICRDLRNQCFAHLQTLPLSFFSKYDRGKLSSRVITDANQISLSFNSFVINYIHLPFIVASTLGICLFLSWKLTIILFLGIPCVVFPLKFITKKIRSVSHAMQKRQESFTSVIIDHLSGIFTIKSYQLEKYSVRKYSEENARMVAFDEKLQKYDTISRPITHFLMTLMLVCILYVGIHVLGITFADLVVYCGVLHMLYAPFKQFSDENASVQKGVVAATRLYDIMGTAKEENDLGAEMEKFSTSIDFSNISFSYDQQRILKNISFSIEKGEVLAITGATGSGKSSLLKLFTRLYNVNSGSISIDGIDTSTISLESLRGQFGLVSQEAFFFNDTIRANLIFDADISDEEMICATKRACIHDFILSLDDGYDTVVEEMGKNLSGGQKQRLSIARALLRKASILLLDEATSSLDAVSEKMISSSLKEMKGDVTQIIVAHRLSTIQHVDKILFLEHGEVKSFGTLREVLETAPGFSAMWEASKLELLNTV